MALFRKGPEDLMIDPAFSGVFYDKEEKASISTRENFAGLVGHESGGVIAIIEISGALRHGVWWSDYKDIRKMALAAEMDPDVSAIAFILNTPGGTVAGCFDTVDLIAGLSKPTMAFADEMAASSGYALMSACDFKATNRTGIVGSIGVVMVHQSIEGMADKEGVKFTLIHHGKRKVDLNPYKDLPDIVVKEETISQSAVYDLFVDTVAKNTDMTREAILATESRAYAGQEALEIGMIDAVMTRDEALNYFLSTLSVSGNNNTEATSMSTESPDTATVSDKADEAAQLAALEKARQEGAEAERERVLAITGSDEAKGREGLAAELVASEMSAEQAIKIMTAAPKAAAVSDFSEAFSEGAGAEKEDHSEEADDECSMLVMHQPVRNQ